MAGYCTCCGGSGYRRPGRERARIEVLERFIETLAAAAPCDVDFQAEEGCDAYNVLVEQARKLRSKR